jgi:DNA-binding CsgD family transcriptional regulator
VERAVVITTSPIRFGRHPLTYLTARAFARLMLKFPKPELAGADRRMILTEVRVPSAMDAGTGRPATPTRCGGRTSLLEGATRHYCSETCLLQSLAAKSMPEIERIWPHGLSDRDIEYLKLVALGKSNKEIGVALGTAESTVKNRLSLVFDKLDVQDRAQAMLRAHAIGVINLHQLALKFAGAH